MPNVEGYEQSYPVTIRRQELRTDTAGAGEFRGGAGVDYVCDVHVPTTHAVRSEGVDRPTGYGTNGGLDGAAGLLDVDEVGQGVRPPPQYGLQRLGPSQIRVRSSAGGGWGDPMRRDPQRVLADVRDEIVSVAAARAVYGVAIAADGRSMDAEATRRLRAAVR